MTDLTEQRLHDLLEETAKKAEPKPTTLEGKVGAFYKSFMDEPRIEKAGTAGLKALLADIQSAKTREALAALMGRQNSDFHGGIFGVFVDVDIKEPKKYAIYLGQAGSRPSGSRLLSQAGFRRARSRNIRPTRQLLKLLEWPEAEKRAAEVIEFETQDRGGELDEDPTAGPDRDL